jgi:predicted AAA+ superfamily ATPase
MAIARYLEPPIESDLDEKMVFVAGPRQVGKTTLAHRILETRSSGLYLNWDNREHRRSIREAQWPSEPSLVVVDEIHKWRGWKRWIKGEFDVNRDRIHFLVTGSARLDVYRRGGDSLQGRYHHYRLHPLSLAEMAATPSSRSHPEPGTEIRFPKLVTKDHVDALMEFGGFPEPLLAANRRTLRRWQKQRVDRFLREDVRDLESVRALSEIEILTDLLPDRVGSLFSLNALREDLEISHRSVNQRIEILERLYFAFRLRPFVSRRVRSLKLMPKIYLWDWSEVADPGSRFENLIALHLLKMCHYLEDAEGHRVALHYLRDRAGHEVDFVVTHDGEPWFAVEAKLQASTIDPAVYYFRDRLKIPWTYQVTLEGDRDFVKNGVRCLPAHRFLAALI